MARQSRNRNAPNLLQGKIQNNKLGHVWQLHHDAIQSLKAEIEKIQGKIVGKAIEFRICNGSLTIDERNAIRVTFEHDSKFFRQRLICPVTSLTIAASKFGRKRNYAFQHSFLPLPKWWPHSRRRPQPPHRSPDDCWL